MRMLRERRVIIYIALFMLLLSLCNIAYDASCFSPSVGKTGHGGTTETQLSGNVEVAVEYFTTDISLSSDFSFTRIEQTNPLLKRVNRVLINSVFAILFKIAVIPGLALIVSILMFSLLFSARWRIVEFIYQSDGKKGESVFLPV